MTARPPLPSLRALTAELRALHEAWSHPDAGGEYVMLALNPDNLRGERYWRVIPPTAAHTWAQTYGREFIPGSVERECENCLGAKIFPTGWPCSVCTGSGRVHVTAPFDAVAAARRLLAAARDGGAR